MESQRPRTMGSLMDDLRGLITLYLFGLVEKLDFQATRLHQGCLVEREALY